MFLNLYETYLLGEFPSVQVARIWCFHSSDLVLIPVLKTEILQATQRCQKIKSYYLQP